MDLPAAYAWPQSNSPGLDQVNVTLPASLKGRGQLSATITAKGEATSGVTARGEVVRGQSSPDTGKSPA